MQTGCRTHAPNRRSATQAYQTLLMMSRAIAVAVAVAAFCFVGTVTTYGQAPADQKQLLAEQAFKNIQVLRGISVSEFMEEMGFFSAALTANCTTCHGAEASGSWDNFAVDTPLKQTARRMVLMMNTINQTYFGGKRELTCYSCHNGNDKPRVTPTIADVYSPPSAPREPDTFQSPDPDQPSADKILDRYIQAVGGLQKLSGLTSYVAKGTSQGYAEEKSPLEVFAKAPGQLTTIVHGESGDRTAVFNGSQTWIAGPADEKPVPVLELSGDDLNGARLDAMFAFPAQIKQALNKWRVTSPTTIDGKDVQVIQGTTDGRTPVNLYFDPNTGLLVREVRYTDTKIGLYSTQIDYSDYREVAGVKMPFHYTVSWLDGKNIVELSSVQPNVAIDSAKFSKPAVPAAPKSAR